MDEAIFPSRVLTDGHTEPSDQNCIFRCIFSEKCQHYICTLSPHVWPLSFSSFFRHSGILKYTFLKDGSEDKNYLLVKWITF